MQRDLNLIRDLLLFYESDGSIPFPSTDGDAVGQHLVMLVEAGLLGGHLDSGGFGSPVLAFPDQSLHKTVDGKQFMLFRVTWAGHDFLASARDGALWRQAVSVVGGMALAIVKDYLDQMARRGLGLT